MEMQWRLANLVALRGNDFGISADTDWRRDREMYGNQNMIEIAELIPGSSFINGSTDVSTRKTFVFSLFYEYIKNIGPIKVKEVAKKWEETKSLLENYDSVLNDSTDIFEFLLLSHKIVAVGDYFCVPQILPKACNLVKNDASVCLKFLMENLLESEESDVEIDDDDLLNTILIDECGENVFKLVEYDNNEIMMACANVWTTCTNLEMANSVVFRNINCSDTFEANQNQNFDDAEVSNDIFSDDKIKYKIDASFLNECETSGTNCNSLKQRELDNMSHSKELVHDMVLNSLDYNEQDNCLPIEATQLDESFQCLNVVDHESSYVKLDLRSNLHDDGKAVLVIRKDTEKVPEQTIGYTFHCDELQFSNEPRSVLLSTIKSEVNSVKLKFYDTQDFEAGEVNSKVCEREIKVGSDLKCKDIINLQSDNADCQDSQIESDIDFERLAIRESAHLLSTVEANCDNDSFIEEQKRNFISQYLINKINQDFKNSYGLEADITNQKLQDLVVNYLLSDQTDSSVVSEICADLFFDKDNNKLELQKGTPRKTGIEEMYEQLKRDFSQLKQYTAKLEQEKTDTKNNLDLLLEEKYMIARIFDAKREKLENELKVCRTHLENKTVESEQTKPSKRTEICLDKLMQQLRIKYSGVLESDLLESVEDVRKMYHNSLSEMYISEVINEAESFIMRYQEKQLCKYSASVQVKLPSVPSGIEGTSVLLHTHNHNHPTSSSTSSASSIKKYTQVSTQRKNAWAPVYPECDTWKKESEESECNICIEPMETMSKACSPIYTLRCQHSFHKSCIQNWFRRNHSCPTCRVHCTMDDEFPPLR